MPLKAGRPLRRLEVDERVAPMIHPAQEENVQRVTDLIKHLRSCAGPADLYEFQQRLLGEVLAIEERRAQCSRVTKRLERGQTLPADAIPPPQMGTPTDLESWRLEAFVYERLARQLRTVGDGLAWRCFGFDRRIILALSRNQLSGMMFGQEGLRYERTMVEDLWTANGNFALMHDLTTCVRITDLTEFRPGGVCRLHEVKKSRDADKKQKERAQAAVDAITNGGPLPGPREDARLVGVSQPHRTNLGQLNDLLQLARQHGARGMKLSQGRAMMASYAPAIPVHWIDDPTGTKKLETIERRAQKRAGIDDASAHVRGVSADMAARSPIIAPWSIFPFAADDCAELITDRMIVQTTVSADALADHFESLGLHAEVALPVAGGELRGDTAVLRVSWRDHQLTIHADGLSQLLYELVEPKTWALAIREVLTGANQPAEPVLVFNDESKTWFAG